MTLIILHGIALIVAVLLCVVARQHDRMTSREISYKVLTNSAFIMFNFDVYWMKVKNVYGHKVWLNQSEIRQNLEAVGLLATFECAASLRRTARRYQLMLSQEE